MKASKATKTSPKKGNVSDISCRMVLASEFNKQNVLQDLKGWNEQMTLIVPTLDKLEKVVKKEITLKSTEISKAFSDAQTKAIKLNHELESTQKKTNKALTDFEKKLLTPLTKGEFSGQPPAGLEEAKANIAKIQSNFDESKTLLTAFAEKLLKANKRIAVLEGDILKLCFGLRI